MNSNDRLSRRSSLAEIEASDVDILSRPRSNPVNMPETMDVPIQGLPVITGEGSASMSHQIPVKTKMITKKISVQTLDFYQLFLKICNNENLM